jgi:hypothetical protein
MSSSYRDKTGLRTDAGSGWREVAMSWPVTAAFFVGLLFS